jgi:hypothetical protein
MLFLGDCFPRKKENLQQIICFQKTFKKNSVAFWGFLGQTND